jgi:hypothetical protein
METADLIRRWRKERLEILKKRLFPEELAKWRRLGRLIQAVLKEQAEKKAEPKEELLFPEPQRIPLSVQREKLVEFLKTNGKATRTQITYGTGIPPGSLSSLLKGKEFEQVKRGFWALKKQH